MNTTSAIENSIRTAADELSKRNKQIEKLRTVVAKFDFHIKHNVAYDGNCFFNAVGSAVGVDGVQLREEVARYVLKEKSINENTIYDDGFLTLLQTSHADITDSRACKATADYIRKPIMVVTDFQDERPPRIETITPDGSAIDTVSSLHQLVAVGHIVDSHFVPLVKNVKVCAKRKASKVKKDKEPPNKKKLGLLRFFSKQSRTTQESEHIVETVQESEHIDETVQESENTVETVQESEDLDITVQESEHIDETVQESEHTVETVQESEHIDITVQESECIDETVQESEHIDETVQESEHTVETVQESEHIDKTVQESEHIDETVQESEHIDESILGSERIEGFRNMEENRQNCETVPTYRKDIGYFLNATMSKMEATNSINNMSDQQKYILSTDHFKPDNQYSFKTDYKHGCNRKCPKGFSTSYPFLVYSDKLDGVFCIYCALFAKKRTGLNKFVNVPFRDWSKLKEKAETHAKHTYHGEHMADSNAFKLKMEKPQQTIPHLISSDLQRRRTENKVVLTHIIRAVLYCAKQCIGMRGTEEDVNKVEVNPGNFLAYLRDRAEDDELLKKHLRTPQRKNVTYTSPAIQNEIIGVISSLITESLVNEIRQALFYTILADEVTSHNKEVMPLCIRFVDASDKIREEFLEFIPIERITGRYLSNKIVETLDKNNIQLENMRGQCYDGAANMSSDRCGVNKYIMDVAAKAPYMHCSAHALNLVIVHSCKITDVRYTLDKIKQMCIFFKYSAKREGLLCSIVNEGAPNTGRKKPLIDLCKTRWAERHIAFAHFYDTYIYLVHCLQFIAYGTDNGYDLSKYEGPWDSSTRSDAVSFLHMLTSFSFITIFMIIYQGLAALSGISVQLQSRAIDVYDAYKKVDDIRDSYLILRENIGERFKTWYEQACRMGQKVGVDPEMPRVSRTQRHRPNAVGTSTLSDEGAIESYFRQNFAVPFIDHIVSELDLQFSGLSKKASGLLCLIPAVSDKRVCNVAEVCEVFGDDIPSPVLLEDEYQRWCDKFTNKTDKPDSCSEALKSCDIVQFPNIHQLLRIACTFPVTSAECERSGSVLRRLHHYNRTTMGSDRLTALALIHIHYGFHHNMLEIVNRFCKLHPRRMELDSLLSG